MLLCLGKVYGALDVVSCVLMTIGLILFTYADQTVSPNFDITGIILISLALCADAAIGKNAQCVYQYPVVYSRGIFLCTL